MAQICLFNNPNMAQNFEKQVGLNFRPSEEYMHMPSGVNISFEDFLGHLRDPAVCFLLQLSSYDEQ